MKPFERVAFFMGIFATETQNARNLGRINNLERPTFQT